MQKMKKMMRTASLYMLTLFLVGSAPLTVVAAEEAAPKKEPVYTYNEQTGHWDSDEWQWDPVAERYMPVDSAQPMPPTSSDEDTEPIEESSNSSAKVAAPTPASPTINSNGTSNTTVDTKSSINNKLDSDATTGNAGVNRNMVAGDATTGDAAASTTVVNTIHSTLGGDKAGVAHFTADIYGNVVGDITISPGAATSNAKPILTDVNTDVDTDQEITNDLDLKAKTGDADVTENTKAGNAKSGNAHTVANIINLINSIVSSNKSFVGTINIYGNLDGDILVSPEFIPQLIGSNADKEDLAAPLTGGKSDTTINDEQAIINNIRLGATTGTANNSSNTSGGSATTGKAATNLTVLNLTGKQVVAKNSLLVFVNVLGKWVGMIVDAPEGATAAALGTDVTTNTTKPKNETTNVDNKSKITNNVDLSSESGDANVARNSEAGDATSGDATASANLVNIDTSTFSVSDWFGILFINVFGTWHGSFGINTANGDIVPLSGMALSPSERAAVAATPPFQFGFNPHAPSPELLYGGVGGGTTESGGSAESGVVLASATVNGKATVVPTSQSSRQTVSNLNSIIMMVIGFSMVAGTLLYKAIRRRQQIPLAMSDISSV